MSLLVSFLQSVFRPFLSARKTVFPIVGLSASIAFSAPADKPDGTAYIFTSFRGSGDGLHLAYSKDALNWTDLDHVFLKPTLGRKLLRDPHILHGPDDLYHMVWTTGWKDQGIGYATSKDLINWSEQRFLPLTKELPGATNCWAPETHYDAKTGQYLIVWSSNVPVADKESFRAYYVLTRDFETFTKPQMLFDPGFSNIDATIVESGGKYYVVFKKTDDSKKTGKWSPILVAVADSLLGPYHLLPDPVIENERVEGPGPVTIGDKTIVYYDFYGAGRYGARETTDWKIWKDVTKNIKTVKGQRHGSILPVPASLIQELLNYNK
ncbi:MAG: glycoside hydrolase family 43 protein [Luteolibacter sp.]